MDVPLAARLTTWEALRRSSSFTEAWLLPPCLRTSASSEVIVSRMKILNLLTWFGLACSRGFSLEVGHWWVINPQYSENYTIFCCFPKSIHNFNKHSKYSLNYIKGQNLMLHMTPSIAARISRHILLRFMQMSVTSMASAPSRLSLKLSSLLGMSLRAYNHPIPSSFNVTYIKNLLNAVFALFLGIQGRCFLCSSCFIFWWWCPYGDTLAGRFFVSAYQR